VFESWDNLASFPTHFLCHALALVMNPRQGLQPWVGALNTNVQNNFVKSLVKSPLLEF